MRAARGPNADVDPGDHAAILESGLSKEDITEIGRTITLLRKQDHGGAPPPKILQMLNDCGASQTAGDIVEAQSIVYRGQAAALMAVDCRWSGRFKEDDGLVDRILSQDTRGVMPPLAVVTSTQTRAAVDPSGIERVADVAHAPVQQPTIPVPPVSILAIAERLIEEKAKLNEWRPKTQAQVRSVAELFVKMIGADDASLVNQSQIAEYRSLLLKLPKNYGKDPFAQ